MEVLEDFGINPYGRLFSTHMDQSDVVMGETSRLEACIREIDQLYHPDLLAVMPSSVSAVIGADIKGICHYMQDEISAILLTPGNGGFRGDYTLGLEHVYRLLAQTLSQPSDAGRKRRTGTYNILGCSPELYRAHSDLKEIQNILFKSLGMRMLASYTTGGSVEALKRSGEAEVNLVLRREAIPAAEWMEAAYGIPYLYGAPYGYAGTLTWISDIAKLLKRQPNQEYIQSMEDRQSLCRQAARKVSRLRTGIPQTSLFGSYDRIRGLAQFLEKELQIQPSVVCCTHSGSFDGMVFKTEQERIDCIRALNRQFILAGDEVFSLCNNSNYFVRIAGPLLAGSDLAVHLPLMGFRGADYIMEETLRYIDSY